jgi:hypothetical protein
MPSPGSESAMVVRAAIGWCAQVHHLVQIEGIHAPGHRHAHGVADEMLDVMILEEVGIGAEDRALRRLLDVRLNRQHPRAPDLVQKLIHHLQRGEITILAEVRLPEHPHHPGDDLLHRVNGIGNQQRAARRPDNDQELGRLHQNRQVPLLHQEAANHGSENHQDSNDGEHWRRISSEHTQACDKATGPASMPTLQQRAMGAKPHRQRRAQFSRCAC